MNDKQRAKERQMSHVAIGGLKLTANQFRCEDPAKYRATMDGRGEERRGQV